MLIDADTMVTVMLFDPEQEEYYTERMTIEETLSLFTEEGLPNPVERPQLAKDIVEPISNGNVIMSEDTYEDLLDRPQGEWINKRIWANGFYERGCSICGAMKPQLMHTAKINYCPNCGARMKGADDEADNI